MSKLLRKNKLPEDNSYHISQIASSFTTLPIGFIAMFSGAWTDNSTIPGWYKCDGNNGTVNLVNKFIRGGTTSGATGGSDDAVVVSHDHTIDYVSGSPDSIFRLLRDSYDSGNQLNTGTTGVSGTDKNIPAYYQLIFIQRIS